MTERNDGRGSVKPRTMAMKFPLKVAHVIPLLCLISVMFHSNVSTDEWMSLPDSTDTRTISPTTTTFMTTATTMTRSTKTNVVQHNRTTSKQDKSNLGNIAAPNNVTTNASVASINPSLLDWEMESLIGMVHINVSIPDSENSCNPPPGVGSYCCIGNAQRIERKDYCRGKTVQDYEKVRDIALRHMEPLTNGEGEGTDMNEPCDECRIVELLLKHNLRMRFIGDSITGQWFKGWACALQRRQMWETIFYPLTHDRVSKGLYIADKGQDPPRSVNVTFYNQHVFLKNISSWQDMFDEHDILVVNYGVHWAVNARLPRFGAKAFKSGLQSLMEGWKNMRFPPLLAMRESSAQHFVATDGEYFLRDTDAPPRCGVLNKTDLFGWRDKMVVRIAEKHGIPLVKPSEARNSPRNYNTTYRGPRNLVLLPFREFTSELHFMHPQRGTDCTHYCSSPYLWLPALRSLRIAVEKRFG